MKKSNKKESMFIVDSENYAGSTLKKTDLAVKEKIKNMKLKDAITNQKDEDESEAEKYKTFYGEVVTEEYLDNLAKEITEDFVKRAEERQSLELKWQLNINFLAGRQYSEISPLMEINDLEKRYEWQSREVFNHIAPIIETRCAKLSRVRPRMAVRSGGDEESDIYSAKLASKILSSSYEELEMDNLISSATTWSEICGSAFYKIVWDTTKGRVVGKTHDGNEICEGNVLVTVCPPFEIYPHTLTCEDVDKQRSIIHAKPMHISDIESIWGHLVSPQEINIYHWEASGKIPSSSTTSKSFSEHCLVLEFYEMPSTKYPQGRLIIVADGQVLHLSQLPFENTMDKKRTLPFVKQVSIHNSGSFFGTSVIERCIPIQRAYNAVKNRKHEVLNRIAAGVLAVEDGSTDIELLEDEGLAPGKIVVYRQGSQPPVFMQPSRVPTDFTYEEERLLQEFKLISGVSDVMRNSATQSNLTSGVAISMLIEQDDTRLSITAEHIRRSIKAVGKQILRLFKQYASSPRLMSVAGDDNAIEKFYFSNKDITADDIVFETENELSQSPAQRKSMVLDMLRTGLLSDENGNVSMRMKSRIADLLGFSDFENGQDIINLNIKKAAKENISLLNEEINPLSIDDHDIHIDEHIKFMLSGDFDKNNSKNKQNNFLSHINQHQVLKKLGKEAQIVDSIEK